MRRRFFVEKFAANAATMQGDAAHHLGRVLRAQPGQLYELSDGQQVRLARIEKVTRAQIDFVLLEEIAAHPPGLDIVLLLSIVKFDAFEWALEKATELGVAAIVPLAAARSEKALLAAAGKRAQRWQKILAESSQQSRRLRVPELQEAIPPAQAFQSQPAEALKLILSEGPEAPPLRQTIQSDPPRKRAVIAIGPEGGWTEAELAAGRSAAFREASLGKLILRTETAVAAALASVNYALGD